VRDSLLRRVGNMPIKRDAARPAGSLEEDLVISAVVDVQHAQIAFSARRNRIWTGRVSRASATKWKPHERSAVEPEFNGVHASWVNPITMSNLARNRRRFGDKTAEF